jgi:hypothetical protein
VITDSGTRCRELYAPADEVLQAQHGVVAAGKDCPSQSAVAGGDPFGRSRQRLEQIVGWLDGHDAAVVEHGELEAHLQTVGRELLCCLFQEHLDLRAAREQRLDGVADGDGVERRAVEQGHRRALASVFGEVSVDRLAYRQRGEQNMYVADGALNLPEERASHGVRRLAAIEAAAGSFEHATGQVREHTGLALGKRQVEELTVRAAVDFEQFYAERTGAADEQQHDRDDVLVLTADGKGIVMRAEALREATARAAARASPKLKTRLSKGEKANRKRIAEVGAVYDIKPAPRTPADVLAHTKDKVLPAPKAKHKWLTASVVKDAATVVADIFDEAQRRDPAQQRQWVCLVDGNNHQIDRIKQEAKTRKVKIAIVVDVVHVLEYLWGAAWCFFDEGDPAAEQWVHDKALAILEGKAGIIAAAIRRKAHPPAAPRREAREGRPRRGLPAQQASLPRLPHRASERVADRDGRDRGRLPPSGEGPDGHHRRPLGPPRSRSDPETTRGDQQPRLQRLLGLSPRPRTTPQPRPTLRQRRHPTQGMTSLQTSRTQPICR